MSASVVILAAGRGDRMQADKNKILLRICGQALLCHTVQAFTRIPELDDLVLVVRSNEMEKARQLVEPIADHYRLIEGGETRRDSALIGVRAANNDTVLIHDGARPFPSPTLIQRILAAARNENAVIPVLPITDLLHRVDKTTARIETLSNSNSQPLVRAQTPQAFRRDFILRCLEAAPPEIRDDATAILLAGEAVTTVAGEPTNIKITRPEDLLLAEAIAASRR